MKHMVKFTALVCCSLAAASLFADPATGWKRTGAGPYVYDDPDNWVGRDVNGIFGSDLTLTAAQTITFTNDLTLAKGLSIGYNGAFGMTFQSDAKDENDAPRPITLTLGGGIVVDTVMDNGSIIIKVGAGSTDPASKGVTIDLGGVSRTVSVTKSKVALQILNKVTNGGLVLENTGSVRLDGTSNDYGLGTTFKGTGPVNVMNDALGTGDITVTNAVLTTSGNRTFTRNNKLILDGTLKFSSGGNKLDLSSCDIFINKPVTIETSKGTLILGGKVAADSPYGLESVTKAGGETLQTVADIVSDSDVTLTATQGTWLFDGAVITPGKLAVSGGGTYGSAGIRLSSARNSFTGPVVIEGRENTVSLVFTAEDSLPGGVTFLLKDNGVLQSSSAYSCTHFLQNHLIDTASTGIFCVGVADSTETVDLSDYPNMYFGASGGNLTFKGQIVPGAAGYRLGGPNYLYLAGVNALTGKHDVFIKNSCVFVENVNDVEGTVHVPSGVTLTITDFSADALGSLPNCEVVVEQGGSLNLKSSVQSDALRAKEVVLKSGSIYFEGNKTYAVKHRIDKLTLLTAEGVGGTPQTKWSYQNSKQTTLEINSVVRPDPCFWNFAKYDKDNDSGKPGLDDGRWSIIVKNGVSNVGNGTAGTTTTPIVPWVRHEGSFVYYDSERGFHFLDATAERETYSEAAVLSAPTMSNENMYFNASAGGTLELTGESMDITSFAFGYQSKSMYLTSPNGKINVTSGGVFCEGNVSTYLDATLDFGENRGYIMERAGKQQNFRGAIKGSGGLTIGNFSTANNNGSGGTGLNCAFSDSTFTGDVHIFDRVDAVQNGCFPYGERTGNTYLHGYWLCGNFSVSLNGLYGAGYMQLGNSYNITYTLGCDGSDGDYDGRINRSNGTFNIDKIGAGRQRFGGECTHNGATTVSAGTLQVDGAFTKSAVTVAQGATLAGCGTFGQGVTLADGAKLEVGSAKLGEFDAEMNFEGGITFQGASAVTFKVLGKTAVATLVGAPSIADGKKLTISLDSKDLKGGEYCLFRSDSELSIASYSRGANCGPLSYRNDGKELWMKKNTSFSITLR